MSEESYQPDSPNPGEAVEKRDLDLDAMGNEKRRTVIGKSYGPSVRKQLTVYGIVLGVIILIGVGFLTIVSGIDNRDIPLENTAPWAAEGIEQEAPGNIDFTLRGDANEGKFPDQ